MSIAETITKENIMTTQTTSRIHAFGKLVALSFPSTEQLYLTPEHARNLAKELKRFADASEKNATYGTRISTEDHSFNEFNGKKKPHRI